MSLKHCWNYIVGKERGGGERSIAVCSTTNLTQRNVRLNCSLDDQMTATNQDIRRGREGKSPRIPNLDTTWNRFLASRFKKNRGGVAFYKLSSIYKLSGHSDKADTHGNLNNCRPSSVLFLSWHNCYRGHAVAQLVEALRYKSEGGRWFDSRWCE
jgi:hypothetical protein